MLFNTHTQALEGTLNTCQRLGDGAIMLHSMVAACPAMKHQPMWLSMRVNMSVMSMLWG
jgi:hypothetical protein